MCIIPELLQKQLTITKMSKFLIQTFETLKKFFCKHKTILYAAVFVFTGFENYTSNDPTIILIILLLPTSAHSIMFFINYSN